MSDWKQESINRKYAPIPEDAPRHRKRSKKKNVRSDHKHEYETVCVDGHSYAYRHGATHKCYYLAKRCKICGRIGDVDMRTNLFEPPEGMPLYDAGDFSSLFGMKYLTEEMRVDG